MKTVIVSFNAVFPILAYVVIGRVLKAFGFWKAGTRDDMDRMVFKIFIPFSVFSNIYTTDIKDNFDMSIVLFVIAGGVVSFIIICLLVPLFEKDRSLIPVIEQGIHRGNYGLLGIPIVQAIYGDNIGMTAMLLTFISPMLSICATIAFERARGNGADIGMLFKKVITNHQVIACILAVTLNLSGIKLPDVVVDSVIKKLAALATPIAMMSLGSAFSLKNLGKFKKQLMAVCAGRLIIFPAIFVTAAWAFGIRDANLAAMLLFSGAPAAVASYSTAVSMDGNPELAGQIVIITTALSVFTLFGWLCLWGGLGIMQF